VSPALLEAPLAPVGVAGCGEPTGGSRPTLEELLDAAWRGARSSGQAQCPVCCATMRLEGDHARCRGCGSALS
jgi:hypothetical protein